MSPWCNTRSHDRRQRGRARRRPRHGDAYSDRAMSFAKHDGRHRGFDFHSRRDRHSGSDAHVNSDMLRGRRRHRGSSRHASRIVIVIAIYIGHEGVLSSRACGLPMPLAMPYAARGAPSVLVRCAVPCVPVLAKALRQQLRSQGRRERDEFATLSHLHAVRCFEHCVFNERMCVRLGVESVHLTTRSNHPCQL